MSHNFSTFMQLWISRKDSVIGVNKQVLLLPSSRSKLLLYAPQCRGTSNILLVRSLYHKTCFTLYFLWENTVSMHCPYNLFLRVLYSWPKSSPKHFSSVAFKFMGVLVQFSRSQMISCRSVFVVSAMKRTVRVTIWGSAL